MFNAHLVMLLIQFNKHTAWVSAFYVRNMFGDKEKALTSFLASA